VPAVLEMRGTGIQALTECTSSGFFFGGGGDVAGVQQSITNPCCQNTGTATCFGSDQAISRVYAIRYALFGEFYAA